jgi:hypothetical protein
VSNQSLLSGSEDETCDSGVDEEATPCTEDAPPIPEEIAAGKCIRRPRPRPPADIRPVEFPHESEELSIELAVSGERIAFDAAVVREQ